MFNKAHLALTAVLAALGILISALPNLVQAEPAFGPPGSLNELEFGNFENQYRSDANCQLYGNCLGGGVNAPGQPPAGYQTVNPAVPNNVQRGDLFIGIFQVREISNNVTGATWSQSLQPDLDQLTGYFVQEVIDVGAPPDFFDSAQTQFDHIELGVASVPDPFDVVNTAAGEMFAIFRDDSSMGDADTPFSNTGPILGNIATATDGTLFATLGPGVGGCDELNCTAGYTYNHADLSQVLFQVQSRALSGLNNQILGPAYNAGNLAPINDNQENESTLPGGGGGFATPPLPNGQCASIGLDDPLGPVPFRCNDYILTSEVELFTAGFAASGTSPWVFASNDPVRIYIPEEAPELACRLTGGGVTTEEIDGQSLLVWDGRTYLEGEELNNEPNTYQIGGQVGARTALDDPLSGEWNHHQQRGPAGSFVWHCGTSSAVTGTEIIDIRCSDPGGCAPSGNPPSPNKQIDFDCIGHFENVGSGPNKTPDFITAGANVKLGSKGKGKAFDGTLHFGYVNVDDLGEGPDPAEGDPILCPINGFGEKGAPIEPANCDCPDFYRISILDGVDTNSVPKDADGRVTDAGILLLKSQPVIYEVKGYLKAGNGLQLHKVTGFDR